MDLAPGAPPLAWGGAREGARYRDFVSRRLAELEKLSSPSRSDPNPNPNPEAKPDPKPNPER